MNSSDAETSESSSSSSDCPGPAKHGTRALRHANSGDEGRNSERSRSASTPPRLWATGREEGESLSEDARQHRSGGWAGAAECEANDNITRTSTSSPPVRSKNDRPSTAPRNHVAPKEMRAGAILGDRWTSRRRSLSAPQKAYPFIGGPVAGGAVAGGPVTADTHLDSPRMQTPFGEEAEPVRAAPKAYTAGFLDDNSGDSGKFSGVVSRRGGGSKNGEGRGRCGVALRMGTGHSNTAQQPPSFSSTFGAESLGRTSEDSQPSNTAPDGNRGGANCETNPFASRGRGGGRGGEAHAVGATAPAAEALSSQHFGLRRWKEYAVLRHGNNRRFVESQHGREILAETAAKIRTKEVEDLNRELKEMRALVEELHGALRAEQVEKSNLQARVLLLEREIEEMDSARRRWLKEGASNRSRGSNLERRLAGNTGTLRAYLFGADPKSEMQKLAMTDPSSRTSGAKASAGSGASSSRAQHSCGGGGGSGGADCATTPEGLPRKREQHEGEGAMLSAATAAEASAVRRAKETAELEKSEMRRRHQVELAAKQSRIEKLKLEIRKLEAERDGFKQAAENQAGLFKDGYAELKACVEQMKTCQPPPPPAAPSCGPPPPTDLFSDGTPAPEPSLRSNQGAPSLQRQSRHAHNTDHNLRRHQHTQPSELAAGKAASPAAAESSADAGREAGTPDTTATAPATPARRARVAETAGAPSEAKKNMVAPARAAAGDTVGNGGHGTDVGAGRRSSCSSRRSSCSRGSEGSGTLWVRVTPTDDHSSEDEVEERGEEEGPQFASCSTVGGPDGGTSTAAPGAGATADNIDAAVGAAVADGRGSVEVVHHYPDDVAQGGGDGEVKKRMPHESMSRAKARAQGKGNAQSAGSSLHSPRGGNTYATTVAAAADAAAASQGHLSRFQRIAAAATLHANPLAAAMHRMGASSTTPPTKGG